MFCKVGFSIFVAGIPPVKTFGLPIRFRDGPIIMPLATPPGIHPVESPAVIGVVVAILCAGINEIKCLILVVGGNAIGFCPILGYGIGVGIGPAGDGIGVRQTSTGAISMPPKEQFQNILFLLVASVAVQKMGKT
jgi:hypothetical protein